MNKVIKIAPERGGWIRITSGKPCPKGFFTRIIKVCNDDKLPTKPKRDLKSMTNAANGNKRLHLANDT